MNLFGVAQQNQSESLKASKGFLEKIFDVGAFLVFSFFCNFLSLRFSSTFCSICSANGFFSMYSTSFMINKYSSFIAVCMMGYRWLRVFCCSCGCCLAIICWGSCKITFLCIECVLARIWLR